MNRGLPRDGDSGIDAGGDAAATAVGGGQRGFGRWLYDTLWILCRTLAVAVFGFRVRFAEPLPRQGGLLVLSSHQSHLDPLLLGLAADRRLSNLARSSLYRFKPFAAVITALDAVPIDRGTSMVKAMKAVIGRLRDGRAVVVFPEGTRTATGRLGEIKGGFALLAKKAGVPIVPVAIVGAYECWPRSRLLPRPGRIRLEFGRVIPAAEIARLDEQAILEVCTARIHELDATARRAVFHVNPRYRGAGRRHAQEPVNSATHERCTIAPEPPVAESAGDEHAADRQAVFTPGSGILPAPDRPTSVGSCEPGPPGLTLER